MKIGLIGLKKSGKTTIFNTLTGLEFETSEYTTGKIEPNIGTVFVEDERVTLLSEMYKPQKTIYAHIEYTDFAGTGGDSNFNETFSTSALQLIKNTDALAIVLRNFKNEVISETYGFPDPVSELNNIESELILSDLIIAEKRMEKIILTKKRGIKDNALTIEEKAIEKIIEQLNENLPLNTLQLKKDEEKAIRGFQFLTMKPIMLILNSDEENFQQNKKIISELSEKYKLIEFAGNFEMELTKLSSEDAEIFMTDIGIKESARIRLTKFSYELLGYISFFTIGKDEVRAWTITNGDTALDAAGAIHSDLARGFIRAECFNYDDLMEAGSEKSVKDIGKFRLEGKDYIVKDGDILSIRFSV
jgi:GTP-binding protein YchF